MEYQINLRKVADALFARKWFIIAVAAVALVIGILITDPDAPDMYSASATIYSASYASYKESVEGINAMLAYVDIIESRKVAERASAQIMQALTPEQIMGMVYVSYAQGSAVLTVSATSTDPNLAVNVANAVAGAFVQEVISITAVESVKILDSASYARIASDGFGEAMRMRAVAVIAGAVAAIVLVVVFSLFDSRVAFPREITLNGELELLGVIPDRKI